MKTLLIGLLALGSLTSFMSFSAFAQTYDLDVSITEQPDYNPNYRRSRDAIYIVKGNIANTNTNVLSWRSYPDDIEDICNPHNFRSYGKYILDHAGANYSVVSGVTTCDSFDCFDCYRTSLVTLRSPIGDEASSKALCINLINKVRSGVSSIKIKVKKLSLPRHECAKDEKHEGLEIIGFN
jgi:hypothetical protein